ncbi:MAG: hypothetical protein WCL30_06300 [Pseudomonadota bacterium]
MSENPIIKIAGKDYSIPLMAVKQNRIIEYRVFKNLKLINGLNSQNSDAFDNLTQETIDDLYEIVFVGLTRADVNMTRATFDNLNTGITEIFKAIPVIMQQSGLFAKASQVDDSQGEAASGEARATQNQ